MFGRRFGEVQEIFGRYSGGIRETFRRHSGDGSKSSLKDGLRGQILFKSGLQGSTLGSKGHLWFKPKSKGFKGVKRAQIGVVRGLKGSKKLK